MKPYYLLDTNVVSELNKPFPNENVMAKMREYGSLSAISTVTWQELTYGLYRMPEGRKKDQLIDFMDFTVQSSFEMMPFNEFAAHICGDIEADLESKGIGIDCYDLQIASIAIANNMILVTRNTKHFIGIKSLMLENWFDE